MSRSTSPERALRAAIVALLVALPRLALACPMCMAADARRSDAYVATTVLLSLLPLGAIGGIGWLIWRRTRSDIAPPRPAALEGAAPAAPERLGIR